MLIPLGTDRRLSRPTVVTHWLIGANVAFFVAQILLSALGPKQAESILQSIWLDPQGVTPWGFLTYQFLHGGVLHLVGNMIFLYVFGPNIEDRLRRVGFLIFYLVGGVAAGGLHILFEKSPVIGASGSIAAVTGAYFVLFPRTHIKTLVFFFIIGVFQIPATWFIGFAIAKDIFLSAGDATGVAHLAHIGGYLYGGGLSFALLASGRLRHEDFDLFNLGRQAHRRRQFKSQVQKGAGPWEDRSGARRTEEQKQPMESKPSAREEAIMSRRREVASLIADGNISAAADSYTQMLREHGPVSMNQRAQLELANHFFQNDQPEQAARAYRLYLDRARPDAESARVKLMLGLLYTRYLNRPEDARPLLRKARSEVTDTQQRELAEMLLQELGEEATSP